MAKIYLDEIDAFLASGTVSTLTNDSQEGTSINDALLNFVDLSSSQLVGNNWDNYRSKFASFNSAIQARMKLASKLGSAIQEALQLLKNYLGDDQMLDSSKLEEYKRNKQICQNSIENLNSMLSATADVQYTDTDGTKKVRKTSLYDANEIRAQINSATETLNELDRMITKIEGLDEVYSQAEAILQSAFAGIDTFKGQVENIIPDTTFTYKRV